MAPSGGAEQAEQAEARQPRGQRRRNDRRGVRSFGRIGRSLMPIGTGRPFLGEAPAEASADMALQASAEAGRDLAALPWR